MYMRLPMQCLPNERRKEIKLNITVKNKYHYFGKTPADYEEEAKEGWEPGWYFRIVIETNAEDIRVEDCLGRYVPINFTAINELTQVVQKVQQEIICAVVGAPNNA
jgi:hypothetical protein